MRTDSLTLWTIQKLHDSLDLQIEQRGEEKFISNWDGIHPKSTGLLQSLGSIPAESDRYVTFDADSELRRRIVLFHHRRDEQHVVDDMIIPGQGASPLIIGIALWLRESGFTEVFYLPPIYFTFGYILNLVNIRARPVSGNVAFAPNISLNLPERRTVLILSDPVWFAGWRLPERIVDKIRRWQKRTGSIVIVDGAFQYMAWSSGRPELSARFEPAATLRLICPTKSLAVHGYRFAYLLAPIHARRTLSHAYECCAGSASIDNVRFSLRAMEVLSDNKSNFPLLQIARDRYDALKRAGVFMDVVKPNSGYFVFGKLRNCPNDSITMGPKFFQVKGYDGFVRVNLLNTNAINILLNRDANDDVSIYPEGCGT